METTKLCAGLPYFRYRANSFTIKMPSSLSMKASLNPKPLLGVYAMLFATFVLVCGCHKSSTDSKENQMTLADADSLEALSEQWRQESKTYVTALNEFVRRGIAAN